ncbi:xaa-Pro aminopeptidase 3 [Drosophila busckii]|uniref:xaa-Pro aminopeptidase 3 n=1 Tax=Drosophila busckii TaxID=30019 RepID=UPI00083EE18E|nr:xaa-Pro aminopeptidase 3 [Drosophila busckii]XP_017851607.1 xaa-Pro aminopeptidase 3 [Drosophila busckii]
MIVLKRLTRSCLLRSIGNKMKISTCSAPLMCKAQATTEDLRTSLADAHKQGLRNLGQPTSMTHPHLIRPNELVPGVELTEFQTRRTQLMLGLQSYANSFGDEFNGRASKNHLMIIGAASKKYMSGKIPYVFRQSSNFYYLTGCLEPDSVLMLSINEAGDVQSTLFMRPKDAHAELWDGPRTGPDYAVQLFGVNEAYAIEQFEHTIVKRVAQQKPHLWFDWKQSELPNINDTLLKLSTSENIQMLPVYSLVENMRLIKSPAEMDLMRQTCAIASQSFNEVMAETRPGQSEHQLYAAIDFKCRMRNASYLAYPPVVAAGKNATVIHYVNNTQLLQPQELLLMDAGCEYGGYTSDITRTWPVSGEFNDAQRTLYDMMQQLQKEAIELILQPGGETLDQLFESTCYKLGKYLQEIGLVPKHLSDYKELASQGYKFCPHHVSHYLGMDVHDTPHVPRNTRLQQGMVFTVEPGIYIDEKRTDVPPEFRGIGIRIEDDIVINEQGRVEVLTDSCVKERRALEQLCKEQNVASVD